MALRITAMTKALERGRRLGVNKQSGHGGGGDRSSLKCCLDPSQGKRIVSHVNGKIAQE